MQKSNTPNVSIYKLLTCLVLLVTATFPSMAQQLDPFCNNVLGASFKNEYILIDFSVGEQISIPTLFLDSKCIISSGFLQHKNSDIETYKTIDSFLLKISMGPNPITNYYTITMHQIGIVIVQINILNMQGGMVSQLQGPYSGLNFNKAIDMTMQKEGMYLVQIQFLIDGQYPKTRTYKIFKSL